MKSMDQILNRLLVSAAEAPARPLVGLDRGLENRVLAQLAQLRSHPIAAGINALSALCWRGALASCSLAAVIVALAIFAAPADSQDPYSEAETVSLEAAEFALN